MLSLLLLIVLLAGCAANPAPTVTPSPDPLPESAWANVEHIGSAEQSAAPALLVTDSGVVLAWNSADESEARHFVRGVDGVARIVALKAWHPFMQTLLPATPGQLLLLWLDRTQQAEELHLQAGIIASTAVAELGPNPVSNLPTRFYTALPVTNGALLVWSARLGAVNNLYADIVDRQARPSETLELRRDADYPALVQDNSGTIHLFWLESYGRQVYHATIADADQPALDGITPLTATRLIGVTDSIEGFYAAFDAEQAHFFWNVRHADGTRMVLTSAGDLETMQFTEIRPLEISADGVVAAWAIPLPGQHDRLPVAVQDGATLGVLWLEDGAVAEYQAVVETGTLIGAPAIARDDTGTLYLAWSAAQAEHAANLYMTWTE